MRLLSRVLRDQAKHAYNLLAGLGAESNDRVITALLDQGDGSLKSRFVGKIFGSHIDYVFKTARLGKTLFRRAPYGPDYDSAD